MTTKDQYISQLRLRLNDAQATRWSNTELGNYLAESVNRYSKLFPHLKEQEAVCDGLSTRFDVPADLVDQKVHRVWTESDNRLKEVPSYQFRARYSTRWYEVVDDQVILGFAPVTGAILRLRYSALHTLPATGNSSVPSEDEDLIYLWAEHLAWRKIGGSDASLSRWREDGKRDDSPIIPHYAQLERQYQRMVEEKKAGGRFIVRTRQQPRYRLPDYTTVP